MKKKIAKYHFSFHSQLKKCAFKVQFGSRDGGGVAYTMLRRMLCPLAVPYAMWLEYRKYSKNLKPIIITVITNFVSPL